MKNLIFLLALLLPSLAIADSIVTTTQVQTISNKSITPTSATNTVTLEALGGRALALKDFAGATDDCSTPNATVMTNAETAALGSGIHNIVVTGGCYAVGTHTVAPGIQYWCPGPIATEPANNDYRNMPMSFALTTTAGITFPSNSGEHNCTFLKSNIAQAAPPASGDFQANYARAQAFAGTGVTVTGEGSTLDGGLFVGFATGVSTKNARTAVLKHLSIDATKCIDFTNQPGGGRIDGSDLQCSPFATRFGGTMQEPSFAVSSITDSGGNLLATLSSACTGVGCPLTGYQVWMANADNLSAQSAIGGWIATVVDSTHILFQGSTSAFITGGQSEPGVTVTNGSVVISGLTLFLSQVQPTQSVTGSCITGTATIVNVHRGYGKIWLDSAHPANTTGTCTITIADTAPTLVSIAAVSINTAGSGYSVGDRVSPSTGTGTPAVIDVDQIDNGAIGGPGVPTAVSFDDADGSEGSYSVLPTLTNSPTTGGTGSGLTLDLKVASIYGSAVMRNGPAFNCAKTVDVRLNDIGELSHSKGISAGFNCRGLIAVNCSLHDENVLQDQTHYGIEFWSNADSNRMSMCDSYYFGAAIAAHSKAASNIAPNVVANSHLGGSAGNSGLLNTLVDVACYDASNVPCPATPQKSSITLSGNTAQIAGSVITVMGDARSVNMVGNSFAGTTAYCENDTAGTLTVGGSNSLLGYVGCGDFATSPDTNSVKIQPTNTNTVRLTNGDCGKTVISSAAGGTLPVILPNPAVTGCTVKFRPNTNAITIDPNGATIATNPVAQSSILTLVGEVSGSITFRYDPSTNRWRIDGGAPSTITRNNLGYGSNTAHGQVYMSCKGTCSGGTGQLQVCPLNGSGGLIINGSMYSLAGCIFLDNSVFSAVTSALRYIYALPTTQGVTAMADNGSGKVRLTINSTAGFNTGDPITCVNATGTAAADVLNDVNTTLIDATHIDVTDVSWVATGTGSCYWIGLVISAAGHVTDANGVEVQSGNTARTLVGMAYIDASHNLNATATKQDVASWENRQQNKCISTYSTDRTTSSTSYAEPNSEIECEFVSWGAPATPGLPVPTTAFAASGMAANGTGGDGWNVGAGFDSTSTAQTEKTGSNNGGTTQLPFALSGAASLSEGKHFVTLLAKSITGGTTTVYSSATSLEALPWQ